MMLILRPRSPKDKVEILREALTNMGFTVQEIVGENTTIFGLAGDTSRLDASSFSLYDCVERVMKVQEPYKMANRKFHPQDSVIDVAGHQIGGGSLCVMAGPCSIESEEQLLSIAQDVKRSGATFLRGGAFKPRTSPYAFQGMGADGLELMRMARSKTGLPIVTEIMSVDQLEKHHEQIDIIQIGTRNMQNFELLKEVGQLRKAVLLKRGMSSTFEEMLMSAEYIMAGGNTNVILCERGIRTFETFTRNTLDLSAIPALKSLTHLPVIVDPSHATGLWWMVKPMALAAVAAGADGIMVEVHNQPKMALCDGAQSITPENFNELMQQMSAVHKVVSGL